MPGMTQDKGKKTKVVIARGLHLFPFRTEKLNPATPMVLRKLSLIHISEPTRPY